MRLRRFMVRGSLLLLLIAGGVLTAQAFQEDTPPWPPADADDALVTLNEILSADEFQYDEGGSPTIIQQWLDRIVELLDRILPYSVGVSAGINQLIALLGVFAMAIILFYVLSSLLREIIFEQDLALTEAEREILTAQTALGRAQTLSAEGDYRAAVRYLYLSTLLLLEEQGLLRYDRSRTNREYLRSVRDAPELAATLRDVIDVFDRIWYGYQPIDEATYQQYEDAVHRLQRMRSR